MRLYVWDDVFTDYTHGVAFALAESVEDARSQIRAVWERKYGYSMDGLRADKDLSREPTEYDMTQTTARALMGGA